MLLTQLDKKKIATIRLAITRAISQRDVAIAKIDSLYAQLQPFERACHPHPNGYETSAMGDRGFYCPDCGYSR